MAILPTNLARVSNLLRTSVATSSMSKTQRMLLEMQNQLTTGARINTPSDDPGDSAILLQLQKTLERRQTYLDNISAAKTQLSTADTAVGGVTDLLRQATQIASSNVGSDVTSDQRQSAATLVDNLYNQTLSYANTQSQGTYIFGGDRSNTAPFVPSGNGGVKFVGSNTVLSNQMDDSASMSFMLSGQDVFGSTSQRQAGTATLSPGLGVDTRLSDLKGATGNEVYKGLISITNGANSATVDLTDADTIGDVITRINAQTATTDVTASLAPVGNSLLLTPGAGTVMVKEVGGGTTARDLGILQTTAAASKNGADVQARITPLTKLSSLFNGGGLDASGLIITNGTTTATVGYSGTQTVEDFINAINSSGTQVQAQINADGTAIDIVNPVQGTQMTIGENGGNTATQLGLRTMAPADSLTDLNDGQGVRTVSGDDFTITRQDGTSFSVDADGLGTVADVISAINTAAGTAMASFATTGNGIVLTDSTVGATTFKVEAINASHAAEDLGLTAGPSVGGVITGDDVHPVSATGIFTNLARLRDALRNNDSTEITKAAQGLNDDLDRVIRMRGVTGARVQELESRENSITDENISTQALISNLHDVDYTSAITQYTTLQTSLQASMQTTAQISNLSLMDFLS
jgi:flagellar hook-associated protein 3 FlgL